VLRDRHCTRSRTGANYLMPATAPTAPNVTPGLSYPNEADAYIQVDVNSPVGQPSAVTLGPGMGP